MLCLACRDLGLALYNPLTDNWGELDPGGWSSRAEDERGSGGFLGPRERQLSPELRRDSSPRARVYSGRQRAYGAGGRCERSFREAIFQERREIRSISTSGSTCRRTLVRSGSSGIVRDAKFAGWGLSRPARPMFYVPLAQYVDYKDPVMKRIEVQSHFIGGIMLVTNASPGTLEPLLTRMLAEVDPNLTINSVRTMQQQVDLTFDQERAVAGLAGLFGIVALLLAAVGLYGITAYTVAQRTNEIGIRMALGADRTKVVQLVLRGAFRRVLIGLVLGLPLAVGSRTPDLGAAVWRFLLGSARANGGGRFTHNLRLCRGLDSGQPRCVHLADDCAQN